MKQNTLFHTFYQLKYKHYTTFKYMELSHWEYATFFKNIDVAIIGSGIVGLNAALNLKQRNKNLNIVVFERGFLPSGASTKNAGFACFGSISELAEDLTKHTESEVLSLVEKRCNGLMRLRKNLGDTHIHFKPYGGFEVFDDEKLFVKYAQNINYFNKLVARVVKVKAPFSVSDNKIKQFGLTGFKHMIENKAEGQIDTGKMMERLISIVQKKGVKIFNGININTFKSTGKGATIFCENNISINVKRVLICTNGFAKQLLPDYPVNPARAQVIVTSPIKKLKLKGAFHYDKGYYYFRNINNRVLIGGGRNLDFKGEETDQFGLTNKIQNRLEKILKENILAGQKFEIENRWSGIMGVGPQKSAILKEAKKNIFCAVRMGGMGVAIGSLVGQEAAEMVENSL